MAENTKSSYLQYLSAIYEETEFLSQFLKIFEKILSGIDDEVKVEYSGIEQILDAISDYFHPTDTPSEFLNWLAGWVALELQADWDEKTRRELIRRIVPLYRKRGTKEGIEEFLKIYAGPGVSINEWLSPFQIGVTSTIGKDTVLGEGRPHFFTVHVIIPEPIWQLKIRKENAVRAIIDLEKPAHTYYQLETTVPTLQIGKYSTIGKDTLLGNIPGVGAIS